MSNQDQEYDVNDIYDQEISDDDYGFIVGPDGELKSVFTPVTPQLETPENVLKILKIFGINDPDQIDCDYSIH